MKLLLHLFLIAPLLCNLSFAQGTLETGFVVITPASGSADGLSVSAVFGHTLNGNLFQTSVMPSPLVTETGIVVSADPAVTLDTGIAIANPNDSPAAITLILHNTEGVTVSARTITIGGHQQISRFATELFSGDPVFSARVAGLLFIGSDMPVGVMALALNGTSFTALPVAAQLIANQVEAQSASSPVSVQPDRGAVFAVATPTVPASASFTTIAGTTSVGITNTAAAVVNNTTAVPATAVAVPLTPTFNGVNLPPTLLPIPGTTLPTISSSLTGTTVNVLTPIAGVASPFVLSTGLLTAGVVAAPSTLSPTLQAVTPVSQIVFPHLTVGVGGAGALLLPQVATGAGWGTQITIANTSAIPQTVRADFFNPQGTPLNVSSGPTISNIVIAPGGVAVLTL